MNKKLTSLAIGAAALGMGISMPSCPGQQAMQQQIDTLQTGSAEMNRKMQMQEKQFGAVAKEIGDIKQAVTQMTGPIQAQQAKIDQLEGAIKELQGQMAAKMAAPKAAPSKGKRRR